MRKTTIIFLAFWLAALTSPCISGESLQTNLIPAEARWLIHFDVEKFAQTELKQILDKYYGNAFGKNILGIKKTIGIDFFSDISAVTVIGMNHENDEPVVAFSGNLDKTHLLGLIEEEESPNKFNHGNFLIHNWDDHEYGVFARDDLLIISENRSGLEKVLDTFSEEGKNFSGTPLQRQLRTLSPETFLIATAGNVSELLDEDDDDFGAVIIKKTKSAFFSATEQNSKVRLQLFLQTDSTETASSLKGIVIGLKALLSQKSKHDPIRDIIKSINISAKDTTVMLELQGSVEELRHVLLGTK